jgi:hypothetical protein
MIALNIAAFGRIFLRAAEPVDGRELSRAPVGNRRGERDRFSRRFALEVEGIASLVEFSI